MKWHTTWLPKKDWGSSYQKIKASDARPAARVRRQAWGHVKLMHMRLASRSPNPNPLPGKLKAGPIGTMFSDCVCMHVNFYVDCRYIQSRTSYFLIIRSMVARLPHQYTCVRFPGRFLSIVGQDPGVSKTRRWSLKLSLLEALSLSDIYYTLDSIFSGTFVNHFISNTNWSSFVCSDRKLSLILSWFFFGPLGPPLVRDSCHFLLHM